MLLRLLLHDANTLKAPLNACNMQSHHKNSIFARFAQCMARPMHPVSHTLASLHAASTSVTALDHAGTTVSVAGSQSSEVPASAADSHNQKVASDVAADGAGRPASSTSPTAMPDSPQHESHHAQSMGPFLKVLGLLEVNAVLLSTPESVLAITHLLTSHEFGHHKVVVQGPIFATVAALDAARHLAAELTVAADSGSHGVSQSHDPSIQLQALQSAGLRVPVGSEEVLSHCWFSSPDLKVWDKHMSRIKGVRYGEIVSLDGVQLTATAFPTGASMGAAMWVISDGCRNVGYLSDWLPPSSPSCFFALDPRTLNHLDVLITPPSSLLVNSQSPQPPTIATPAGTMSQPGNALAPTLPVQGGPAPPNAVPMISAGQQLPAALPLAPWPTPQQAHSVAVKRLNDVVLSALCRGGSVLIPLPATGVAWALLEGLSMWLHAADLHAPLVYISPVAHESLALALTSAEFMARSLQASVSSPDQPAGLSFDRLRAARRLLVTASTSTAPPAVQQALVRPCVVVAPVAGLKAGGDTWRLLKAMGNNPNSACVLCHGMGCEPGAMSVALQAALPGLQLRVVLSEFGAPPHPSYLASLLSQLQTPPKVLVMEEGEGEALAPWLQATRGSSLSWSSPELRPYRWLDLLHIKLRSHATQVQAAPALLQRLQWKDLQGAVPRVAARVTGTLTMRQGKWWLDKPPPLNPSASSLAHTTHRVAGAKSAAPILLGQPHVSDILAALADYGLTATEVQGPGGGVGQKMDGDEIVIDVPQVEGRIRLHQGSATVHAPDPLTRKVLADCVTARLVQL